MNKKQAKQSKTVFIRLENTDDITEADVSAIYLTLEEAKKECEEYGDESEAIIEVKVVRKYVRTGWVEVK